MFEYVVWVIDCMGRHWEEEVFTIYEAAYAFGLRLAEDMCSEEDWYIERRIDGQFDCYIGL